MTVKVDKWVWSAESPLRDEIDGSIVRFFKAEGVKAPGVLAIGAPPDATTLFAREAIQNSWDAAREWQSQCADVDRQVPPFWIDVIFSAVTGKEKLALVEELGLGEHESHLGSGQERGSNRSIIGLFGDNCLDQLSDPDKPLKILKMIEHSSLGMPGSFMASESRMMFALVRVGYTLKKVGAGGSFGYGKAGLISSSRVRVVCAYSCFESAVGDEGITRRLMGATYWGHHKMNEKNFTGWARFGSKEGDSAKPYENDTADSIAQKIGIPTRDPKKLDDMGSTFLIVDPTIEAHELKTAIERNWWPAMMDDTNGLRIRITDYDGTVLTPSVPKNDPNLRPFVRAYELANRPSDAQTATERAISLGSYTPHGAAMYTLGTVGLVADPSGWSFPATDDADPSETTNVDHCSMVALVRGPRMIVEYHEFRLGMPYIRGCFIADPSVDDLLRQTEPKAHDKWDERTSAAGIHEDAPKIASAVYFRLRNQVKAFKQNFAPPPPRPGEMNLPILDELSRLMKGKKPDIPEGEPRTVSIRFVERPYVLPGRGSNLRCRSVVEFQVDSWVWEELDDVDAVEVTIQLGLAVMEDENVGERISLDVKSYNKQIICISSEKNRYVYQGIMRSSDVAKFEVTSEQYSSDWSVKFTPMATVTNPEVPKKKARK